MKGLVVIHFQPLEAYPPVMNMVDFISTKKSFDSIVLASYYNNKSIKEFSVDSEQVKILRFGRFGEGQNLFIRLFSYVLFYTLSLYKLIVLNPSCILYYETLSALPVYLYKRYINSKVSVFIHYHEYVSKMEYEQGMKLVRYIHKREKYLYEGASWISHTNSDRLKMFISDEGIVGRGNLNILPNYPPMRWQTATRPTPESGKLRIVYVGSVDVDTMYIREFADWINACSGRVVWDIYSNNLTEKSRAFFKEQSSEWINVFSAVEYSDLPGVMGRYDVGVILYKGHIPNFVFNAPNKLFEYMACGLDVWYPSVMVGIRPYKTSGVYPKVCELDFERLLETDLDQFAYRDGLVYYQNSNCFESKYQYIFDQIREVISSDVVS